MSQAVSTLAHLPLEQLRALARRLGDKSGDNASARIGPRDPSSSPPPLSYAQERLWVMDQIEPAGGAYNIASAVRYEGEVSPAAVEASINDVIRRHEVLRTTFRLDGEAPVQEIAEQAPLGLALVDLSGLPAHASEGEARQMALEQACRPFDLARGPLILATLLRLHSNERILVVSVHHTVFDGWCSHIFSREFDAIHEAFVNGEPSLLAELDIQYADFAVWQREWLQGDRLQKLVWYWKKQLADPGVLNLPTDFARPAVSTYRGSRQSLVLPRAVSRGIEQLSHKLGITQFMVMLAAFKTLLFRISGQGDILTGAPIANRMRVELEGLIGCFVNTLVFRADLSGGPRFEDLCARVSEMCRQAYAHQDLPFEKLVDEINPAREMSRNPLFQAVFNYNNTPTPFQMNDDTSGKINDGMINAGTAVFELTLTVDPADPVTMNRDQMNCVLEYKTDLFDAVTIKRMLGQLALLLEGVVANPAMRLTDLPMLSSAQQHQQLIEWNDTVAGQNHTFKVHHQFELRASERPDAIALQFGDEQLSYGALNHRANQMGNYLRARGVVREDLIAVCLHRSIEWVEAILGVVKAGAAYVPLDPDSPSERLQYMMEGVRILITAGKGNRPTANSGIGIVNIDRDRQEIYRQPSYNPWNETKDSSLVYVIYTSGSTGRPKGVGIEHAGLMNLVAWHLREYSVSHKDRATQVAQVSFDASVWEMWPYLAGGARLEIAAQETKTDPSRLVKWTELRGITISFLPTPLAEAVLGQKGGPASQLKVLLTGGDRLRQGKQKGQRFRLVNHYGPTENTVVATSATVDENGPAAPPIGRPIMNTRVYVLDAQRQPVAIGVPGELVIAGDSLARGYIGRPALTAGKFIPNPYDGPGERLYLTGDLVKHGEDGRIDFIGRKDDQIKLRGYRVEPGEIEAALNGHPAVAESLVVAVAGPVGEKRLVAYLINRGESAATHDDFRKYLKDRLPEYMVPTAFVRLDRFPLTRHGKVDLKALPAPDIGRVNADQDYIPPRTNVERAIAAIWKEVLGAPGVGVRDNFFDLGGNSLLVVRMANRLRESLEMDLSVVDIFKHPTISSLAALSAPGGGIGGNHIEQQFFDPIMDRARMRKEAMDL